MHTGAHGSWSQAWVSFLSCFPSCLGGLHLIHQARLTGVCTCVHTTVYKHINKYMVHNQPLKSPASVGLRLQMSARPFAWVPGPYVCTASTLQAEPSPQPLGFLYTVLSLFSPTSAHIVRSRQPGFVAIEGILDHKYSAWALFSFAPGFE